jgi:hypothetical protein
MRFSFRWAKGQSYHEAPSNVEVLIQEWHQDSVTQEGPVSEIEEGPVPPEQLVVAVPDGSKRAGRLTARLRSMTSCPRFRYPRPLTLLAGYVIALGSIEALTIGLSLAEIRISQWTALGVLAASAGVAGACMRFLDPAGPYPPSDTRLPFRTYVPVGLLSLGTAGLYVYLLIVAWLKVDYSFDGNYYHIPPMHFWARVGYVTWIRSDPEANWARLLHAYMNGYPKGAELVGFVVVQACGVTHPVNALNLIFLPMGVLSIVCLTRWFGVSRPLALLAGCAYVFVPDTMHQAFTTNVDSAFGSSVMALMTFLALSCVAFGRGVIPWGALPALGCAMGIVMGVKGTGPIAAALAGGIVFATLVLHIIARSTSRLRELRQGMAFLMVAAVLAVMVGGYWAVRNTVIGGSPIYPLGISVRGHVLFSGGSLDQMVTTIGLTPQEMWAWPAWQKVIYTWCQGASIKNWLNALLELDTRRGGFGFLWIAGCVPALAALLIGGMVRRLSGGKRPAAPDLVPGLLPPLLLFSVGFFLMTPNNWWARYTLWVYGLGLPAFAWAMQHTFQPRLRWLAVRIWLWLCVVLLIVEATITLTVAVPHPPPYWQPWPGTEYWHPNPDGIYCDMLADQDAGVALYQLSTREQIILGTLCQPIGRRPIFFMDEGTAGYPERLAEFLREREIKYVVCGSAGPVPDSLGRLARRSEKMPPWKISVFEIGSSIVRDRL